MWTHGRCKDVYKNIYIISAYANGKITSKMRPVLTSSIFTVLKIWREFKVITKYPRPKIGVMKRLQPS